MKTALAMPRRQGLALAVLCVVAQGATAVTLYDPALGLPNAQQWATASFPTPGSDTLVGGRLRIDTTNGTTLQHGHGRTTPLALDTVGGFTLAFGLQVLAESHDSVNRAGFSLLVQGADQTQSLELSFWGDQVWALQYTAGGADGGFLNGGGALLNTTSSFRAYELVVQNNAFTLLADGSPVMNGAMRDYPTTANPLTAVYGFSNYLFFGDDTSQARAVVDVGAITLTAVPEPAPMALWLAGLAGLAWRRRKR